MNFDQYDSIIIYLTKDEITNLTLDDPLTMIKEIAEGNSRDRLLKSYGKLAILINGYDNVTQDLWEIQEVRDWISKFTYELPYYYYFFILR